MPRLGRSGVLLALALSLSLSACSRLHPERVLSAGLTTSAAPRLTADVCLLGLVGFRLGNPDGLLFFGVHDGRILYRVPLAVPRGMT